MLRELAKMMPLAALCAALGGGCAMFTPPAPTEGSLAAVSLGGEIIERVPALKTERFSTLLDFESDTDGVFIATRPAGRMVFDHSHTGRRSLKLEPGTRRVAVKLSSLLSGRPFPGDWTLLGGYLYCERALDVTVQLEGAGTDVPMRTITLTPNQWTSALLDITAIPQDSSSPSHDNARFVILLPPKSPPVWCDDVMLIDNARTIVSYEVAEPEPHPPVTRPSTASTTQPQAQPASTLAASWSLQQRGHRFVGSAPNSFNFELLSTDATRLGWTIEEANALRARFRSEGKIRSLTVYHDGRAYWDGELRAMSASSRDNAAFAEQHASPADVSVPEEQGRLNRNTRGDANNDGYNEQRGAYQLVATGPRLEVRLAPRTRVLDRPVLEVTGFPQASVLITIEGRLIRQSVHLDDGTLLVELPMKIDRPTTVNLRIQ